MHVTRLAYTKVYILVLNGVVGGFLGEVMVMIMVLSLSWARH